MGRGVTRVQGESPNINCLWQLRANCGNASHCEKIGRDFICLPLRLYHQYNILSGLLYVFSFLRCSWDSNLTLLYFSFPRIVGSNRNPDHCRHLFLYSRIGRTKLTATSPKKAGRRNTICSGSISLVQPARTSGHAGMQQKTESACCWTVA